MFKRKHKCQFCGNTVHTTALRAVVKRDWDSWHNPKRQYYFHEGCLYEALMTGGADLVELALDIVKCIRREAQRRENKQAWRRAQFTAARVASEHLDSDLKRLYG